MIMQGQWLPSLSIIISHLMMFLILYPDKIVSQHYQQGIWLLLLLGKYQKNEKYLGCLSNQLNVIDEVSNKTFKVVPG